MSYTLAYILINPINKAWLAIIIGFYTKVLLIKIKIILYKERMSATLGDKHC